MKYYYICLEHSQQISLDEGGPIYLNILKMEEWSMDDVCNWLTYRYASWGSQYIEEFKKRNIDGKKLRTLKNKEIINKELGGFIKNRIHLERIWREIQDSYRTYTQLNNMLTATNDDGGTISSKFIRLQSNEILLFFKSHELLKSKFNVIKFIENNINELNCGEKFINLTENALNKLNQTSNLLSPNDIKTILQVIFEIKRDDLSAQQYTRQTVLYIWNTHCSLGTPEHKLLPQHLRDTPIIPRNVKRQIMHNIGHDNNNLFEDDSEYMQHDIKIYDWTTSDCINWLARVKGKIDYKSRYEGTFQDCGITGKDLIHMTPWGFENICCITVKKHIRDMIKAIDVIRTHYIQHTTLQKSNIIQFRKDNNAMMDTYKPSKKKIHNNHNNNNNINNIANSNYYVSNVAPINTNGNNIVLKDENTQLNNHILTDNTNINKISIEHNSNPIIHDPKARGINKEDPKCMVCGKGGNVMRCSNCKCAFYCSRQHQIDDWDRHQPFCV